MQKTIQIKDLIPLICTNIHIELIINHGYTSDLHLYGDYKKQIKQLNEYSNFYITDIYGGSKYSITVIAEAKKGA